MERKVNVLFRLELYSCCPVIHWLSQLRTAASSPLCPLLLTVHHSSSHICAYKTLGNGHHQLIFFITSNECMSKLKAFC